MNRIAEALYNSGLTQIELSNKTGIGKGLISRAADKINPYRLYELRWDLGKYGTTEHRKQIEKYADFPSVLAHLTGIYLGEKS